MSVYVFISLYCIYIFTDTAEDLDVSPAVYSALYANEYPRTMTWQLIMWYAIVIFLHKTKTEGGQDIYRCYLEVSS